MNDCLDGLSKLSLIPTNMANMNIIQTCIVLVTTRIPRLNASIADIVDGSSFDMWVLSKNKIVVVPQAKSSAQAFERLIAYIFSKFNEGTVNVYEESDQATE